VRDRDHFEDLGINGKMILKYTLKTGWKNMNWTDLPQDMAERQALVNTVTNLKFHKMWNVS
jgi:hypothetical protein